MRNTAGLMPLDPEFQRIAEIKDAQGLQAEIAHLHRIGVSAVFSFGSEQFSAPRARRCYVVYFR